METREKIQALTGIRFFAAASIVLLHANNVLGGTAIAAQLSLIQGVSLFFVLSGFILTYNYPVLEDKEQIFAFWTARIARIWPLHIVSIFLLLLWVSPQLHQYWPEGHKGLTFLLNGLLLQAWVPFGEYELSLNTVAWSISAELFFYLMYPLLLRNWDQQWMWKLTGTGGITLCCIIAASWWNLPVYHPKDICIWSLIYYFPLPRLFEFAVGIGACFLYRKWSADNENPSVHSRLVWSLWELLLVMAAVGGMWASSHGGESVTLRTYLGNGAAQWIIGSGSVFSFAGLIIVMALQRGWISFFLGSRWMVLLGEISFAMYLVHAHLLQVYNYNNLYNRLVGVDLHWIYGGYWLLTITLSYLLFVAVEQPCRRWIVASVYNWRNSGQSPKSVPLSPFHYKMLGCLLVFTTLTYWGIGQQRNYVDYLSAHAGTRQIDLSQWKNQEGALFGGEVRLRAVEATAVDGDNYCLQMIWQAEQKAVLRYYVIVQFLDQNGQLLAQKAYFQQPNKAVVEPGALWRDRILVDKKSLEGMDKLAVVCKERPGDAPLLLPVHAAETDWNGSRLLIRRDVFFELQSFLP